MKDLGIIAMLGISLLILGAFSNYTGEYYEYNEKNAKKVILLLEIAGGFYIAIGFLALLIGLGGYTFLSTIPK